MRWRLPASAAAAAVLVATCPSAALGADVTMPGPSNDVHMTYTALPGESNNVTVETSGDRIVLRQFGQATPLRILAMGDCILDDMSDPKVLSCASTGVTQLVLTLGDRDDDLTNTTAWTVQASGEGGHDTLRGGSGDEQLEGGAGPDNVDGGSGNDRIYGSTLQAPGAGTDSDALAGGVGDDLLIASSGADRIDGGPGTDQLAGGDGPDGLIGGDGNDLEDGGTGNDTVGAALGSIEPSQDRGNDVLLGGGGDDVVIPGPGPPFPDADGLNGGDGFDAVIYGTRMAPVSVTKDGAANDGGMPESDNVGLDVERIVGGLASDVLRGGPGQDAVEGGPGDDTLDGLAGDDMLRGDAGAGGGADTISGGPDVDFVYGEGGGDTLSGDEGNDTVDGGSGEDTLRGGPGVDTVVGGPERDVLGYGDDLAATVRLDRGRGRSTLPGDSDRITEVEDLSGGSRRDTFTGSKGQNTLWGAAGEDYVDGLEDVDRLIGGDSPDVVASRDRSRDEPVSCGPGRDFAIIDRQDTAVRRGGDRCELVDDGSDRKPRAGRVFVEPRSCDRPAEDAEFGLPAMHRLVPLRYPVMLPSGYKRRPAPKLDASDCTVRLTAATGRGRSASADVTGDAVAVDQSAGRRVTTYLTTVNRPGCGAAARNVGAARRRRGVRINTRRGRSRVRVRGKYSIGASYGTVWTTVEGCRSTTTIVRRGRVRVFDRRKRRWTTVRAGHEYVAKPGARSSD